MTKANLTKEQIMSDPRVMALVEAANDVKDFRYDPQIGIKLNFLEAALAALEAPASLPRTNNEGETE